MARAQTATFDEFVVEVDFAGTETTYEGICGLTSRGIQRQMNVDESEIPDCDDESLPLSVEVTPRSYTFTISGTGVWARQSHEKLMDWFYNGSRLSTRVRHANVEASGEVGDTITETGWAYLVNFPTNASKGPKVEAEIEIRFDGVPTRAYVTSS